MRPIVVIVRTIIVITVIVVTTATTTLVAEPQYVLYVHNLPHDFAQKYMDLKTYITKLGHEMNSFRVRDSHTEPRSAEARIVMKSRRELDAIFSDLLGHKITKKGLKLFCSMKIE